MQQVALSKKKTSFLKQSVISNSIVYLLTSFHHYYGAIVYNTPWRKDVIPNGGAVMLIAIICLLLYRYLNKKAFLLIYILLSFLVFSLGIGIFEGAYNHLLKDLLYFSGMKLDTWRMLYPAPAYEVPSNLVFESTGIAQFFVALIQIYYLRKVYRSAYPKHANNLSNH
ncbi:MAG: hypothetical protein JSS96_09095 [Bacteroidetes bacterium]|nr:hypothetical protein [Bacteroidota bacterium]